MKKFEKLSNEVGAPVADNENSITAGPRGPVVMQDVLLMEKMAHFNREVIPERRMHAKGWGAYGKLTVKHDISKYTKAKVLQPNAVTELFVRFSTEAGECGAADCERNIRGVAVKFYTEEGNWDLVGNNTPTFFIRDVHNFSDLNRAVKRDPRTGRLSAQNNWDYWALLPECFLQITMSCVIVVFLRPLERCISLVNTLSPSIMQRMNVYGASSILRPNKASRTSAMKKLPRSMAWIVNTWARIFTKPLKGGISHNGQCMFKS